MKRFGVVVFPGANCDHDCYHVIKHVFKQSVEYVWHNETDISGIDCIILPGGFSYGDYLRAGAIARFSPVMREIIKFAKSGGFILGICNGFQILTESGLLPGVLMRNKEMKFICKDIDVKVENNRNMFTGVYKEGQVLRIPIAHADGSYSADNDTIKRLEDNGQIVLRYATPDGQIIDAANPNGSVRNIAAIINKRGNVLGSMPHPERSCEPILGGGDGRGIFESLIENL